MFEKIVTGIPLNKTAAIVAYGKGIHHQHKLSPGAKDSSDRLPTILWKGLKSNDLTGRKFGDLTVIGLYGFKNNGNGAKGAPIWVVQCKCGIYTTRRVKTLNNGKPFYLCCQKCLRLKQVKLNASNRRDKII